jgi:iron complex outermembrane receptor protein
VAAAEPAIESEVVVTARKIAEDPQDVPMSVQVLSGEYLDESRTTRLHELQFAIPGLVVNTIGMFGVGMSMRGISDQSIAGLSVAPHMNGVYLGDANAAIARLFDIERIEVLKGPQGTLYGRNATGGSINVITRAPQNSPDSEIEVAFGSFETTRAQGYLNLPLSNSAMRFAFIASEGDGYIRNSVDNRRFGEDDYWGLRGSYRIDVGDALHVDVMAQHIRDDGASGDLWTPSPVNLVDPHDIRLTTVTLENPYLISEIDNLNVNLEYELGFATLRSITGYVRSEVRNVDDCAGIPLLEAASGRHCPTISSNGARNSSWSFPGRVRWKASWARITPMPTLFRTCTNSFRS